MERLARRAGSLRALRLAGHSRPEEAISTMELPKRQRSGALASAGAYASRVRDSLTVTVTVTARVPVVLVPSCGVGRVESFRHWQ